MTRATRIALVGAGNMARAHAASFGSHPGVELVGICSRTRSRAQDLADSLGIATVTGTVDELWTATRADLVIVAASVASMETATAQCMRHPWAAFVEKPAGLDLAASARLVAEQIRFDSRVYVGLNRRFMSTTRELAADLGEDGPPRYIRVQDQQSQRRAAEVGHPPEVVANWMFANSIHTIDYLRVFGRGEVESVEVLCGYDPDVPGPVVGFVRFSSGDCGLYEGIWHAPGPWAVTVACTDRRWELRPLERLEKRAGRDPAEIVDLDELDRDYKPGLHRQAGAVLSALHGEASDAVELLDAHATMELIGRLFSVDG